MRVSRYLPVMLDMGHDDDDFDVRNSDDLRTPEEAAGWDADGPYEGPYVDVGWDL